MKNPENPKEELYFHVISGNKKLSYNDRRTVKVGVPLTKLNKRPVQLCRNGMHACKNARFTQSYRFWCHNRYLCLVKLSGNVRHGDDKSVADTRTVIAMRRFSKSNIPNCSCYMTASESMSHNKKMYNWILRK